MDTEYRFFTSSQIINIEALRYNLHAKSQLKDIYHDRNILLKDLPFKRWAKIFMPSMYCSNLNYVFKEKCKPERLNDYLEKVQILIESFMIEGNLSNANNIYIDSAYIDEVPISLYPYKTDIVQINYNFSLWEQMNKEYCESVMLKYHQTQLIRNTQEEEAMKQRIEKLNSIQNMMNNKEEREKFINEQEQKITEAVKKNTAKLQETAADLEENINMLIKKKIGLSKRLEELKEEVIQKESPEDKLCVMCRDNKIAIAFVPCREG